jgi:hypothetical protein
LYAFFNQTVEDGHGKGTPGGVLEIPGEFESMEGVTKELAEVREDLERYLNTKGSAVADWEAALTEEQKSALKAPVVEAMKRPWNERSGEQKRLVYGAFKPEDGEFKSRDAKLKRLEKREPKPITTLVMMEVDKPRESFVFIKGDFTRPSDKVEPGVMNALHKLEPKEKLTRLDLANWVVDKRNPLTARVIVNRIWQQYFGRGRVRCQHIRSCLTGWRANSWSP